MWNLIKPWLLLPVLIYCLCSFANDKGGNGTEPFEMHAKDYPQPEKLKDAIELAREKIANANTSEILKKYVLEDLEDIVNSNKFRYLGNIVIITNAENSYRMPVDFNSFIGLGAMTGSRPGNPIYLSEESLRFDRERLAKVIVHELLHHALALPLSHDEKFVEDFATGIMNGSIPARVAYGYRRFFYPREGTILRNQMLYSLASIRFVNTYDENGMPCQGNLDCFETAMANYERDFLRGLPENLAKAKADDVYLAFRSLIARNVIHPDYADSVALSFFNTLSEGRLHKKKRKVWGKLTMERIFLGDAL